MALIPAAEVSALLQTADQIGIASLVGEVAASSLLLVLSLVLSLRIFRVCRQRSSASRDETHPSRHFMNMADLTGNCLVTTDVHGLIEWVNPAFTMLSGYTLAEVRRRKPGEVLQRSDVDREVVQRMRHGIQTTGRFSEVVLNYSKSGRPYWVQIECQPIREGGNVTGFAALQTDVTELRRRESALLSATQRFQLATNVACVGVWELWVDSAAMWWSDTFYEMLDTPRDVLALSLDSLLALVYPDDRATFKSLIDAAIDNDEVLKTRFRIIRSAGNLRSIDVMAAVFVDEVAAERRLIGTAIDVTDRLAREDDEKILQAQLYEASRQAGMAEVATGVLHNIGNVLNSLGINLSSAKEALHDLKLDKIETLAKLLLDNRGRFDAFLAEDPRGRRIPEYLPYLIEHLHETSRIVEGKLTTAEALVAHVYKSVQLQQSQSRMSGLTEQIDVSEVLDVACAMQAHRKHITDGSVQIVREFQPVPPVEMQRHKLLDIVGNLVTNAIDAVQMHDDSAKVIRVTTAVRDQGVEIEVADTGCGIAKENLDRIWEFGFTTKTSGHGFGLHSCAIAVVELGGRMTVHSDGVGRGASFRVWLPISDATGRVAA